MAPLEKVRSRAGSPCPTSTIAAGLLHPPTPALYHSTHGGIFHYSSLTSSNSCLGRCTHRSTTTTLTSQTGAVPWHLVLKKNQQYFFDAPFSCCGLIGHHLDRQTCTAVPGFGLSVLSYRALVAAAAVLIFVCKFRRCQLAVGPRWPNKCNSENYFQLRNHSSFYLFSYGAILYVSQPL